MKERVFLLIVLIILTTVFYLDLKGVHVYIFSLNNFVYLLTLLTGAIIGLNQFKNKSKIIKLITVLFSGVFLFELGGMIMTHLRLFYSLYYFLILFFLLLLHHFIFRQFLENNGKQIKKLNLLSLIIAGLSLVIMLSNWNLSGFPSIAVSLFCIYVISMSLYLLYQLIDVPIKTQLWRNPQFLFCVSSLVMYCIKFWNVSFRPVLHKLPMEVMLKYKFLLFNFSNYIMEIAYCVFVILLLVGHEKQVNAETKKV